MKKISPLFLVIILILACSDNKPAKDIIEPWADAQWIAFEKIEDSLKVVPGIHGFSKSLKNKYKKRSTVPLFRKTFQLTKTIAQATINISGLGHYELYINGTKVGDRFL